MRSILAVLAVLFCASPTLGGVLDSTADPKPPAVGQYQGGGRTGGDTVADAVVIPEFPFADPGETCGYANDYDAVCPYTDSTAPDVVYSYTPAADVTASIDLCAAQYDTKVYVWQDAPGALVACNDDAGCGYSGFQSRIEGFTFLSGHQYYIVIDGYGTSCGEYQLAVTEYEPCVVECPAGALAEGEPACGGSPYDEFNGGCATFRWEPIRAQSGNEATLCGQSCTFVWQGLSYRDTDWFNVTATGGPLTLDCTAEFPQQLLIIYGTDCHLMQWDIATADPCAAAHVSRNFDPGREAWLWVGPSVFSGVPVSDYVLRVSGILGDPSPFGACCTFDGCRVLPEIGCTGIWQGPGTTCPFPCPTWGACCRGEYCSVEEWHHCHAQGGDWLPEVSCDPDPCSPTPVVPTTWGRVKFDAGKRR